MHYGYYFPLEAMRYGYYFPLVAMHYGYYFPLRRCIVGVNTPEADAVGSLPSIVVLLGRISPHDSQAFWMMYSGTEVTVVPSLQARSGL